MSSIAAAQNTADTTVLLPAGMMIAANATMTRPLVDSTNRSDALASTATTSKGNDTVVRNGIVVRDSNIVVDSESANKNKAKTNTSTADTTTTTITTPYLEFFATYNKFMDDNNFLGSLMIGGLSQDFDDDDDDDDDEDSSDDDYSEEEATAKLTKEQMESLRFILITPSRADRLDEMRELVLADQADSSFMMFDTAFSYHVLDTWRIVERELKTMYCPAERLDLLVAYTFTLKEYNVWMYDNEGDMDELVHGLAAAWRRLLMTHSDGLGLGWDVEYTKPGVMELLRQFKASIASVPEYYDMGTFIYAQIRLYCSQHCAGYYR